MVSAWPQFGIFLISVTPRFALLPLVGGVGDRPRNRVVFSPSRIGGAPIRVVRVDLRLGPRVRLALAIWARAIPDPATW